ncbi:hypothetical protein GCM10017784_07060 [Deinococcus indicus]|uniref:helix-turn-helix domain-containing protein n=1 Tax=Deinococcus indicus TaxID=223556 RepID=UPI00174BA013|nr:helix-turn-helix domain-containing protein [Deinococcus indicus]GHG18497.1 hypothetical protein GCM10017784_07060 [Deinococcus indicus]
MIPNRDLNPNDLLVLTPAQAGQLLNVCRSKIYDLAKSGELATITLYKGGPLRILRTDLDVFIAGRKEAMAQAIEEHLDLVQPRRHMTPPQSRN